MKLTAQEIEELDEEFLVPGFKGMLRQKLREGKSDLLDPSQSLKRGLALVGGPLAETKGEPYLYTHNQLLAQAKRQSPSSLHHKCTVTEFSGWVHNLYAPQATTRQLEGGKRTERIVARKVAPRPDPGGWDCVYYDDLDGKNPALEISRLTINGQPLRGRPDIVFRKKRSKEILIVDRKAYFRSHPIPSDGWPDVRAQLWAYSWCDEWADATKIRVVAEIWGGNQEHVYWRGTVGWDARDKSFDKANCELFLIFGGHWEA